MKIQAPLFRKSQAYDAGETITQSLPHACYSLLLPKTLQEACCRAVLWDMGQCHEGWREPFCPYLPSCAHGAGVSEQAVCDHIITDCAVIHAHNVRAELRLSRQLQAPLHH